MLGTDWLQVPLVAESETLIAEYPRDEKDPWFPWVLGLAWRLLPPFKVAFAHQDEVGMTAVIERGVANWENKFHHSRRQTIIDALRVRMLEDLATRLVLGQPVGPAEQALYLGEDINHVYDESMAGYDDDPIPVCLNYPLEKEHLPTFLTYTLAPLSHRPASRPGRWRIVMCPGIPKDAIAPAPAGVEEDIEDDLEDARWNDFVDKPTLLPFVNMLSYTSYVAKVLSHVSTLE